MATTEQRPLKVLTPTLAERLQVFNAAARTLQQMGVRLLALVPLENRLNIRPEDGRALINRRLTEGYQRFGSAGSTRYSVQFQGVTLEWREPISHTRPEEYSDPTFH